MRLATLTARLPSLEDHLDGLVTNGKFCFARRSRLKLRPKRRGYPPQEGVLRGGINETQPDHSSQYGGAQRRHSSLGSGLPAPAPMGGPGTPGEPTGGGG